MRASLGADSRHFDARREQIVIIATAAIGTRMCFVAKLLIAHAAARPRVTFR
jgi:hypothetical protein